MKKRADKIKTILWITLFSALLFLFIQANYKIIKESELKGAIHKPEKPKLTIKKWFSGEFQKNQEAYLNETFGFRNSFIRINNQIAFSFFNKALANGIIIGKENYLYEKAYIDAFYGNDFVGIDSIQKRMEKLQFIQDTLQKLNKTFVLIFAAGKGSFYPEYIPDKYKSEKKRTNYETYLEFAKKLNIAHIDFNKYFLEQKDKSEYPLYPQYGIHWSYYGACLVADSILKYIERERQIDLASFYWDSVEIAQPKNTDYDIADGMNILFKLKSFEMAYPKICFESDSNKSKVSSLVISDSFYWDIFGSNLFYKSFSKNDFWYFNRHAYFADTNTDMEVEKLDLKDEIEKHDVIIIMATEATSPDLGWGFIENLYDLFKNTK
ncbi:MAG: hypothetical protein GX259_09285 [Bacteroidales bacterium]|nr:hypothetical protein [Bacteroidales bacterium]